MTRLYYNLVKFSAAAAALIATASLAGAADPTRFSIQHMDPTADPGADFYRYATGHWLATHEIPADQTSWSPTNELIERNQELLRGILVNCATAPQGTPERQVGDFYAAAMNAARRETLGVTPIQADLDRIQSLKSLAELAPLQASFDQRGLGGLFTSSVAPDERDSTHYALSLGQGGLSLPDRDYYFKRDFAKQRTAYKAHIVKMLRLLGSTEKEAEPDLAAVISIETALAKASRSRQALSDPIANYHKMPFAGLSAAF